MAAGAAMLWRFRHPFLLMPVAVALWYFGMDLAPFLAGADDYSPAVQELRNHISLALGLAAIAVAFIVDLRTRSARDYAFWIYLAGLLSFWGGLTLLDSHGLPGRLAYLAVNTGHVLAGAVLGRRTFAVFGGIGIALGLGNLSWTYFKDSFAFTLALSLLGIGIVACGIVWQRHEARIAARLRGLLPDAMRRLLDRRAAGPGELA